MASDGQYLYTEDVRAIKRWTLGQWREWLTKGNDGWNLALAASMAPLGPEGDAARAAYSAAVELKHAAISAAAKERIKALFVRPGERGEPPPLDGPSADV